MSGLIEHPEYKCYRCNRWTVRQGLFEGRCKTLDMFTAEQFFCAHFEPTPDGPFHVYRDDGDYDYILFKTAGPQPDKFHKPERIAEIVMWLNAIWHERKDCQCES